MHFLLGSGFERCAAGGRLHHANGVIRPRMLVSAASFAAKRDNPRMLTSKPTFAALLLFGGLALSAILLAADLKFLGVMVGVIAVPAAFTVLISDKEEKYY
jgi:hypothetical protein